MKTHHPIRLEVTDHMDAGTVVLSYETARCAGTRWVKWPMVAFSDFEAVTCKRCLAAINRMAEKHA